MRRVTLFLVQRWHAIGGQWWQWHWRQQGELIEQDVEGNWVSEWSHWCCWCHCPLFTTAFSWVLSSCYYIYWSCNICFFHHRLLSPLAFQELINKLIWRRVLEMNGGTKLSMWSNFFYYWSPVCWETRAAPCVQWVRACIKGLIPAHWTSGLRTDELGYGRYEPYIVVSYLRAGNARY